MDQQPNEAFAARTAAEARPGRLRLALAAQEQRNGLIARRAERLARLHAGLAASGRDAGPSASGEGDARPARREAADDAAAEALERFLAGLLGTIDREPPPPQPARLAPSVVPLARRAESPVPDAAAATPPEAEGGPSPRIACGETGPARAADVAPEARATDVAPEARAADVLPEARAADVLPEARAADVLPAACPANVPPRAIAPDLGGRGADGLARLPGAGPGLVAALLRAGVGDLATLAALSPADLAVRLGPLARLIDLEAWIAFAREAGERGAAREAGERGAARHKGETNASRAAGLASFG